MHTHAHSHKHTHMHLHKHTHHRHKLHAERQNDEVIGYLDFQSRQVRVSGCTLIEQLLLLLKMLLVLYYLLLREVCVCMCVYVCVGGGKGRVGNVCARMHTCVLQLYALPESDEARPAHWHDC
jgi:hypothetical protein